MRYELKLSTESVDGLLKQLKVLDKKLNADCDKFMVRLTQEGVEYARSIFGHIDTGETIASIRAVKHKGKRYSVIAGGSSVWWEFGTGIRAESPHSENTTDGGQVTVGARQYSLTHYQSLLDPNATAWYYLKNGKRYKTIGHIPNRFMTLTAMHLTQEAPNIFKEMESDNK